MPINFPSSPTLNQEYTFNGRTWKWNGSAWLNIAQATSTVSIGASAADILSASNGEINADDQGSDKLYGWDDSAGKAVAFSLGSGLSITGATINSEGGGGGGMTSFASSLVF